MAAGLSDESAAPFLGVALAAEAVLVTANLRHFPVRASRGGRVVSPTESLDILRAGAR